MDGPAFEIGGAVYPVPTAFRIPDPALVREVTGMDWETFVEGLREEQEDPVLVSGLVAVAVWQANPSWPRARVIRFLNGIDFHTLTVQGGEDGNGADAGPPEPTGGNGPVSVPSTPEPSATPAAAGETTPGSGGTLP